MVLTIRKKAVLFIMMAISVCIFESWLIQSRTFMNASNVFSLAITLDICLLLPAVYWLFVVRKSTLPSITMVPVFLLSVVAANVILPGQYHKYLDLLVMLIPVLEIFLVCYAVLKIRLIYRTFKEVRKSKVYAFDAFVESLEKALKIGVLAELVATELFLIQYALTGFLILSPKKQNADYKYFSCYKEQGYPVVLGVLVFISVFEIPILHIILHLWSPVIAWIVTGLSVYGIFWLVGDFHALRFNPVTMTESMLHIRTGLRFRADIPYSEIEEIRPFKALEKSSQKFVKLSVYGEPQYVIQLKSEAVIKGLFGIKRESKLIGMNIDNRLEFEKELKARIG
ncbi:MAG: PH domain-containing protein [Clostridia bacterium]|nr:PH domain-containing protein [Clostridia bacterium]